MIELFDKIFKKDQLQNRNHFSRVSSSRQSIVKNDYMIWTNSSLSNNNNNNTTSNTSSSINNYQNNSFFNDIKSRSATSDQMLFIKLNDLNKPSDDEFNSKITLGIHVIPAYDLNTNRDMGLIIHKIEPSGRIFKDGRIKPGDRIVEINEKTLIGIDFKKSQEILREALNTSINQNGILDFKLIRNIDIYNKYLANIQIEKQEEEINEKQIEILNDEDTETINSQYENETSCDTTNQQITNSFSNNSLSLSNINALNTRKIGNKVTIQLIKGTDGLGFKLAARDNCTPGEFSPIYVKNILPKGAAIQDGRLQRGDRLLEVNKVDMTQKTVNEAVNILRNTKMGSCVELIVSRQNASNNNTSFSMKSNNNLSEQFDQNDVTDVENKNEEPKKFKNTKETLILDIQLNDTGSAGLGVSVKGKTKKNNDEKIIDLGIFVKTVINGGAASKDGRLKPNDQLIKINGMSLLNKSNEEAMQILRESMQIESSKPGHIELVVTRKKNSTKENFNNLMQPLTTDNNNTNNSRQVLKLIKNDNENNNNNKDEINVNNTARFNRDAPSRRSVSEKRTKIGSSGSSTSTINKFQRKSSIQKTPIAFSNFNENNNNGENSQNDGSISQKCPSNYDYKEDEFKKQNHSFQEICIDDRIASSSNENDNHNQNKPGLTRKSISIESFIQSNSVNELINIFQDKSQHSQPKIMSKSPSKFGTISGASVKHRVSIKKDEIAASIHSSINEGSITGRARSINRSFRTAVDKSFDIVAINYENESSKFTTEENKLKNKYLNGGEFSLIAPMRKFETGCVDAIKSANISNKKGIIQTFQHLFKANHSNVNKKLKNSISLDQQPDSSSKNNNAYNLNYEKSIKL